MSLVLRAELAPCCSWAEIDPAFTVARCTYDFPLPMSRVDPREQVLQKCGDTYTLFEKSHRSGEVRRITFRGRWSGPDMRLSEWVSGSSPVYQLKLRPLDGASVVLDTAIPIWFRLWWNQHNPEPGGDNWYIKSTDSKQLESLRFQLLDGIIPESLKNQEEMWQRINDMPEAERRGAMASLAMHTFQELDRKISEMHTEQGPVPEELDSASAAMQARKQEFEQLATNNFNDPTLERQIRQYVSDAGNPSRSE
jgi:hypothetical protein